jgi:NADH-quinone oxidoreductase subunit J
MRLEVASKAKQIITAVACLIGLGVFLITIYGYDFNVVENSNTITTEQIGRGLLSYEAGGFILPFEVISVLLLAAMIGAIIIAIARKKQPVNTEKE